MDTSTRGVLKELRINMLSRKLDVSDNGSTDKAILDCHLKEAPSTRSEELPGSGTDHVRVAFLVLNFDVVQTNV